MRLNRRKPRIESEHAEFAVTVAVELDDALRVHREALDALTEGGIDEAVRERLLTQARQAAFINRTALLMGSELAKGLPEPLWPFEAIRTLDRVAYGLVALAQEPPDVGAALTCRDLDGLVDDDLADWMRFMLERAG